MALLMQGARRALRDDEREFLGGAVVEDSTPGYSERHSESANKAIFWFSLVQRGCFIWGTSSGNTLP